MMPIRVPLYGKVNVTSNMSSIMKGGPERSNFIVGRVDVSLTFNILELGNQPFPNLLLCYSNFSDEQYLSFLVCGSHHFIVDLLLV